MCGSMWLCVCVCASERVGCGSGESVFVCVTSVGLRKLPRARKGQGGRGQSVGVARMARSHMQRALVLSAVMCSAASAVEIDKGTSSSAVSSRASASEPSSRASECYPEGYYVATANGTEGPTLFYVSIEQQPLEPTAHLNHRRGQSMTHRARHGRPTMADRVTVGDTVDGTESTDAKHKATLRCIALHGGKCPFSTGTCEEEPASHYNTGSMTCTFDNGEANATISEGCVHIEDLTDDPDVVLTRHTSQGDECGHYVNTIVCTAPNQTTGNPGCDCSTPDKCVVCAMQYHTVPSDNYDFSYDCSGRPNPLEEIRSVCNATVGRTASPVVPTARGPVQGFKDVDSLHYVFRGIPFATPPNGSLRFRPPQPMPRWTDVLNVSEYGSTCIQHGPAWRTLGGIRGSTESSEDCLYLNVFSPAKYLDARANVRGGGPLLNVTLAPVMVYFPAGQFMWGSGNDAENFNAPQTPAGGEVVVITANYRLGAFGYLGLDALRSRDPAGSTGNYGSLDQRAVLQWVHDNIEAFGGDPNNVVLWGESAGAAAVTAHLSMPGSFHLYHKAVLESGAFNGWSYRTLDDAQANALTLVANLGCMAMPDNVTVNITCLETVDANRVITLDDDGAGEASVARNKEGDIVRNYSMPFMDTIDKSLWSPVIDGVVLFDTPVSLLRGDKIAKVPILLGTNRDEGSTFTGNLSGTGDGLHTPDTFYNAWLYSKDQVDFNGSPGYYATMLLQNESQFIVWATDMFGTNASKVLTDMYRPGTKSDLGVPIQDWWWSVSAVVGDFVLTCPARRTVRTLEKLGRNESAYVFLFDHTPKLSVNQAATDLWGAFHGSEVPFVWYDLFELATEEERQLSAAMVQYWVNFAWNGDPNTPPPHQDAPPTLPQWAAYTTAADDTMIFGDGKQPQAAPGLATPPNSLVGSANVSTITGLKKAKCDFWDSYSTQWVSRK
eukprot:m.359377 g.359377  ORF g.359377 m.359377 type:complete len:948 (+) comp28043_c1_seq4:744-3587(+)